MVTTKEQRLDFGVCPLYFVHRGFWRWPGPFWWGRVLVAGPRMPKDTTLWQQVDPISETAQGVLGQPMALVLVLPVLLAHLGDSSSRRVFTTGRSRASLHLDGSLTKTRGDTGQSVSSPSERTLSSNSDIWVSYCRWPSVTHFQNKSGTPISGVFPSFPRGRRGLCGCVLQAQFGPHQSVSLWPSPHRHCPPHGAHTECVESGDWIHKPARCDLR